LHDSNEEDEGDEEDEKENDDTLDISLNKLEQIENQGNSEDFDIELNDAKITDFTSCAIIDKIDGEIKRCNSTVGLRPLRQLVGFWEIDREVFNEKKEW
jgi:hypothetical protein